MKFKPKARFKKVTDITPEFLLGANLKGLILDLDNTLITLDREPIDDIEEWIKTIKNANIKVCICTNTWRKKNASKMSKKLGIPYVRFSQKPSSFGLSKAIEKLGLKPEEIAEVGDKVLTDVWGANRLGLYSILTEPAQNTKNIFERMNRRVEKWILNH